MMLFGKNFPQEFGGRELSLIPSVRVGKKGWPCGAPIGPTSGRADLPMAALCPVPGALSLPP